MTHTAALPVPMVPAGVGSIENYVTLGLKIDPVTLRLLRRLYSAG